MRCHYLMGRSIEGKGGGGGGAVVGCNIHYVSNVYLLEKLTYLQNACIFSINFPLVFPVFLCLVWISYKSECYVLFPIDN